MVRTGRLVSLACLSVSLSAWAGTKHSPAIVSSCPDGRHTFTDARHTFTFVMQPTGVIADTGQSAEGPTCVQVLYNRFRFETVVSIASTVSAGKDVSGSLTGGTAAGEVGGPNDAEKFGGAITILRQKVKDTADAIADLKTFLSLVDTAVKSGDPNQALTAATTYYESTLRNALGAVTNPATGVRATVTSTDLPGGACPAGGALTQPFRGSLEYNINTYKQNQADVLAADQAAVTQAQTTLAAEKDSKQQVIDKAAVDAAQKQLKGDQDAATPEAAELAGYVAFADLYKCNAAGMNALTTQLNIVQFWSDRLAALGFNYPKGGKPSTLNSDIFLNAQRVSCMGLFNQNETNAFSISSSDEAPTLDGGTATAATTPQAFFTVNCSSPFTISAGVEVSGVPDQEFAIVQAPAANNTSVPEFQYTKNSPYHLLPVGITHARLWESPDQRFAFHASAGMSGNFQGSGSGGSTAEFLFGGSFSLFRTMFFTAGAHLGFKSELQGGFGLNQPLPSTVQSVQVNKIATVRYGFAVTFTKP